MTELHARLLCWLLLAWLCAACSAKDAELPCAADRRCLRYGLAADIPLLDPHLTASHQAGIIFRQIFDTLVYRDAGTHRFTPGLAEAWQVSDDGLRYTFSLRQDIVFHDGAPFDAAAVARNFERIYDPQLPADHARALLGPLASYEILDEFTLRLSLSAAYPALLDSLAQPFLSIASPLALDKYNELRHQFYMAGTGPFRLQEHLPGEGVTLRRFHEYRVNPSIYAAETGGNIERIEFLLLGRNSGAALQGIDQSLDIIDDLTPASAQNLAGNSRVQLVPIAIPGSSIHFVFNTRREHVNQRELRLALLLAANREAIVDQAFFNFSPVAWAPLAQSSPYAHSGYINQYAHDPKSARQLLTATGYVDGDEDGILEHAGRPLSLSIIVPPWGNLPAVATQLQRQWQALGIELRIENVPSATRLLDLIESGEYDLLPVERHGLDPQLLGAIFLDDGEYANSRAPNAQLDAMIRGAMRELDPDRRRSQIYAIQSLIMEQALILPIRDPVRLTAARADLESLRFDAYGLYPLLRDLRVAGS